MNRNTILEAMYDVIKCSIDWGTTCQKDYDYAMFVDGVVAMTDEMLTRLDSLCQETSQE